MASQPISCSSPIAASSATAPTTLGDPASSRSGGSVQRTSSRSTRSTLSTLPFGASLISSYDKDAVALGLYGLILLLIALTRLAIWWYATGHPDLLHAPVDAQSRRAGLIVVGVAAIIYTIAIALADASPTTSLAIYAAAPVLYFIGITISRASAPQGSAREDFT
jgi:hypothetical protein